MPRVSMRGERLNGSKQKAARALEREKLELKKEKWKMELEMSRSRGKEASHGDSVHSRSDVFGRYGKYGPKIPKLGAGGDIEAYLGTFERLTTANECSRDSWASRLAAVITGKAREAYALMPTDTISDYDKVKLAILKKYQLGYEAYREKFRTSNKEPDERFQEWGTRVSRYFDRWLEINEIETFEKLREHMIIEQMINLLSPDLQLVWIKERKPTTTDKLTELAELYFNSRRKSHTAEPVDSSEGPTRYDSSKGKQGKKFKHDNTGKPSKDNVTCFTCNMKGHYAYECPDQKERASETSVTSKSQSGGANSKAGKPKKGSGYLCLSPSRPGFLNHKQFELQGYVAKRPVRMLLDTGCSNTLVKSCLIPYDACDGNSFEVLLANGMTQKVLTAKVVLSSTIGKKECIVGVLEKLPVDVLLSQEDFVVIGRLKE
ncbi:uncharacterized protein LOC135489969 [Lineus longissimus]|uniref:uncharacterized protein LOC135489969 n=1 Tax=Lineus longissimus TaxID=88925 RepID=UPI00315DF479